MSEPRSSQAARLLGSMLLPGLPQVLERRWASGATAVALWLGCMSILIGRWHRVWESARGPLDGRVAVAALAACLLAAWTWSLRDVRGSGRGRDVASGSPWARAQRAFSKNRLAVVGLVAVVALSVLALITPLIAPYDPVAQLDLSQRLTGPSSAHPLGTDHFARDVLSRLLYGARVSLGIGFVAVAISVSFGTLVGAVAGYFGGRVDSVIMRAVDMVISFPRLVLLIAIVALVEPSIFVIITVLGLTQWPGTARIVRGEVLSLREREFVQAARALGYSAPRIILRHVVPNAIGPVIVAATLGIGNTIILEAGLSYLGIGVQPPMPSWGTMVSDGREALLGAWWITTFPGLAIVLTVLAFNLAGDGLRDAMDPRLRP